MEVLSLGPDFFLRPEGDNERFCLREAKQAAWQKRLWNSWGITNTGGRNRKDMGMQIDRQGENSILLFVNLRLLKDFSIVRHQWGVKARVELPKKRNHDGRIVLKALCPDLGCLSAVFLRSRCFADFDRAVHNVKGYHCKGCLGLANSNSDTTGRNLLLFWPGSQVQRYYGELIEFYLNLISH